MEFKVFKNENDKILKEYWLTQSEWDALDKTTVQEGDIYHIVGTIDKGDLSADVNASLAKGDSSLQKPTATLAKESFVKVGIDGSQKFDESSYVVAPSTGGTAGQVLKKTANGTEWANESGKLYLHKIGIASTSSNVSTTINILSNKAEKFNINDIFDNYNKIIYQRVSDFGEGKFYENSGIGYVPNKNDIEITYFNTYPYDSANKTSFVFTEGSYNFNDTVTEV